MVRRLNIEDVRFLAHELAQRLMEWGEPIPPFQTRYAEKLESCLTAPFATYDAHELYQTLEEKAAILFYLMVKNHPFQNGNKRVAVTTLLAFLLMNGRWVKVDEQQLYAFAKWVAESLPSVKDATVRAIVDFLGKQLVKA